MRRLGASVILALLLSVLSPGAIAHPHAWIDVKTTVVFDQKGNIVALNVDWLFDAFYTVFVLEDIANADEPPPEALIELARHNLSNLHDYDYFLEVQSHGARQAIKAVEQYETNVIGDRLRMAFLVPLAEPLDPTTDDVSFKIYDPTYYIEIVHVEDEPVALDGAPLGACSASVTEPNPDEDVVTFAAMLDQSETGPSDLGRMFAQTVHVTCQ